MMKSIPNIAYALLGCVATLSVVFLLGASRSPETAETKFSVDFDTIGFRSNNLSIEITDCKTNKAYLYMVPNPRKDSSAGNSSITRTPPWLAMTIDLDSTGNKILDCNIDERFLPVQPHPDLQPNTVPQPPKQMQLPNTVSSSNDAG